MEPGYLLGGALLAAALVGALLLTFRKWPRNLWMSLSERSGLKFYPDSWFLNPHLQGVYRGHETHLDNFTDFSKSPRYFFRITLRLKQPSGLRFAAFDRACALPMLGPHPCGRKTHTGHAVVDERFDIRLLSDHQTVGVFANDIYQRLAGIQPGIIWTDGHYLKFLGCGLETDVKQVMFILNLMVDIAEAIQRT